MTNLIRSNFQAHPFHLVSPSPWPLFTCIALLTLTTSGVHYSTSPDELVPAEVSPEGTSKYKPEKIYQNSDTEKLQILRENKGKVEFIYEETKKKII
jgi:hypothetical protein